MGASLQLPNININPGIGGQGIPSTNPLGDAGAQFLQAFLGTQGNVIRREEERGRTSRSSAEMEQRKQEFALRKAEYDLKLADKKIEIEKAKAQGDALKQLLPALLARGQDPAQFFGAGQMPSQGNTPVPNIQMPGPQAQFAHIAQGVPSEALPEFTEKFAKLATDAQGKADRLAKINEVANKSSNPAGARAILTYAELGGSQLPKEVGKTLFPSLYPNGEEIDPQAMNAATALFRTGMFTWGQSRRQAGLAKIADVPDDVKYTPVSRPRQDQLKAGAQLDVMVAAKPVLDEFSTRKAPGPIATFVKSGKAGGWRELISNPALSPQDRQFLQAGRQFTDAWVRVVSGAQTNEAEYGRFLNAITENFGDDEQTREQKRNMRGVMIQAVSDIAQGAVTPTQAIDRALKFNWTPQQKEFLMQERKKAVQYEADVKAGKYKVNTNDPAPSTPEDLLDQLEEIRRSLPPL